MLLKLATFYKDENKGMGVRGNQLWLSNAAHPAVIAGGVLGGFAGNEIMNHVIPNVEKTFGQRLAHHSGKGLAAAIGAGLGAMAVKGFRDKKQKQPTLLENV